MGDEAIDFDSLTTADPMLGCRNSGLTLPVSLENLDLGSALENLPVSHVGGTTLHDVLHHIAVFTLPGLILQCLGFFFQDILLGKILLP